MQHDHKQRVHAYLCSYVLSRAAPCISVQWHHPTFTWYCPRPRGVALVREGRYLNTWDAMCPASLPMVSFGRGHIMLFAVCDASIFA